MRPEYNFDYGKAQPNRFAGKLDESRVVVVLDPDVARIFQTPDAVNKALRALIEAMPPPVPGIPLLRKPFIAGAS
ncbi:MAG: hypothetical protein ACYDH8_08605 [Syntrophales bacterium]